VNILEAITSAGGGAAVGQLARQFGLQPQQASSAVAALVPALAAGLQRNASDAGGLSGLAAALSSGRHGKYLDDPSTLQEPTTTADGNGILGHVLGSKDASRQVAARAAQQTGIDPATLKKMLPLVAALVMGGLSRQSGDGDAKSVGAGLGSLLGPLLGGAAQGGGASDVAGALGGLLGSLGKR
jgi:hypothetical protein